MKPRLSLDALSWSAVSARVAQAFDLKSSCLYCYPASHGVVPLRRNNTPKEAHRVRVQTRVRFQRRRFRSPIRARTPESESKEEPDLPLDSGVRVQGRIRFAFGLQSPSPRGGPICFGPESPTESDLARHLVRPGLLGRALFLARCGKARCFNG